MVQTCTGYVREAPIQSSAQLEPEGVSPYFSQNPRTEFPIARGRDQTIYVEYTNITQKILARALEAAVPKRSPLSLILTALLIARVAFQLLPQLSVSFRGDIFMPTFQEDGEVGF